MRRTSVAARLGLLSLALPLVLGGSAHAQLGVPGSFSFASPAYSASVSWPGESIDGVLFSGTITANGNTATWRQTLAVGDTFGLVSRPMPILVRTATVTASSVRLELWLPVQEVSGVVSLSFLTENIVHRSELHLTNAGFVPTIESKTRVTWANGYALNGSVGPTGTITFDGGQALDQYGVWQDAHRYGVFLSDPGGAFVGHARLTQGEMLNYLNDGTFRALPSSTEATTYFNGFLDLPAVGLGQNVWSVDALSFMPSGSTPGAFAGLLTNFPGFAPFVPPAPGDLANEGQVVIAVADTGVNPYHEDFRNAAMTAHPSTYLTGYPASSTALNLTFGSDYGISRTADDAAVWNTLQQGVLYWIPGTKIIGAYSIGAAPTQTLGTTPPFPERRIIDDVGHGTGTASVSAGYKYGTCERCLLVIIEGTDQGVAWAAGQPWIDIISNSYGPLASLPVGNSDLASRDAYNAGKSVLYSSGNGMTGTALVPDRNPSFTRPTSGPSWVISVGAASPRNDQEHHWYGVPSDVISYGSAYPAAGNYSVSGQQTFNGTSCATPITAGVEGSLLLHARRVLGDVSEGTGAGILASLGTGTVPGSGPLSGSGVLTRDELEDVLLKTAHPTVFDPGAPVDLTTVPGTPASFTTEGYGLVNRASLADGLLVLDGVNPLPVRANEDSWIALTDQVRDLFWGTP